MSSAFLHCGEHEPGHWPDDCSRCADREALGIVALEERLERTLYRLADWMDAPYTESSRARFTADLRRLAALRAPGDDAAAESTATTIAYQRRKIVALREQVATARRERDEAVENAALIADRVARENSNLARQMGDRDLLAAEERHRMIAVAVTEVARQIRALVAGRGVAASATATIVEALVKDQNEELAARDVEIAKARGLIERAERWITAWVRMTKWPETHEALLADLRAYLGDGT